MQDLFHWIITAIEHFVNNGFSFPVVIIVLLGLLKIRSVQKAILERLPFYHEKKSRIEQKIDLLLEKEGLIWTAPTLPQSSEVIVKRRRTLSLWHSAALSLVRSAKQFIHWRLKTMSKINKAILIPFLSAIAIFVKQVFGYEVSDEQVDMIADVVLFAIMMSGLFMNPKKKEDNDAPNFTDHGAAE